MKTNQSGGARGGLLLLTSLVILTGTPAEAKQRIEFLNNGRGVRDIEVSKKERTQQPPKTVRLQGPIAHNSRSGLHMGNIAVRITPTTAVFPNLPGVDAALDPSRLSGRWVTVFGRRLGNTVDAQMVIIGSSEFKQPRIEAEEPSDRRWIEPSATGAPTGRLLAGVPE